MIGGLIAVFYSFDNGLYIPNDKTLGSWKIFYSLCGWFYSPEFYFPPLYFYLNIFKEGESHASSSVLQRVDHDEWNVTTVAGASVKDNNQNMPC